MKVQKFKKVVKYRETSDFVIGMSVIVLVFIAYSIVLNRVLDLIFCLVLLSVIYSYDHFSTKKVYWVKA